MTPAADSAERNVIWRPNSAPQRRFLELASYEAMYGGAAGGGKSSALLAGLLRFAHFRDYTGILFRRTYDELESYVIPRAERMFPLAFPGADYNRTKHRWDFPSGARIRFSHLQYDDDVYAHQSAEYQQICFDELTHFTRFQYMYLLSRARSTSGLPIMIRSGTNPGGEGHDWVFDRWGPWLDPDAAKKGLPVGQPGKPLWYKNEIGGVEKWVPKGTPRSLSRVFVPARLSDNPAIAVNDPMYEQRLMGLDPVSQEQLLNGNWTIKATSGTLFQRTWFQEVPQAPLNLRLVRHWDRAATEPSKANPNPDWTRGCLLGLDEEEGYLYIVDMKKLRARPGEVKALIRKTAEEDGIETTVGLWQDPASAGKFEIEEYVRYLQGYDVRSVPQTKNKVVYARPVSAQAFAKKIRVVKGVWNKEFYDEAEGFPDPKNWKDDQIDALSGAYVILTGGETTVAELWLRAGDLL